MLNLLWPCSFMETLMIRQQIRYRFYYRKKNCTYTAHFCNRWSTVGYRDRDTHTHTHTKYLANYPKQLATVSASARVAHMACKMHALILAHIVFVRVCVCVCMWLTFKIHNPNIIQSRQPNCRHQHLFKHRLLYDRNFVAFLNGITTNCIRFQFHMNDILFIQFKTNLNSIWSLNVIQERARMLCVYKQHDLRVILIDVRFNSMNAQPQSITINRTQIKCHRCVNFSCVYECLGCWDSLNTIKMIIKFLP